MAHGSWGDAAKVSIAVGVLSAFRTFQLIFFLAIMIPISMFFWDRWVTNVVIPESEYTFTMVSDPEINELGGNRPATISPLFDMKWSMKNDAEVFMESFQLNGEAYRCDTPDQDIDTCDYVSRYNHTVVVNLPVGKTYRSKDQITFDNPSREEGYYRAKVWASDVQGDTDTEY